jgi:hypothetical protein
MAKPITPSPDSNVASAPVNSAPNMPPPAMDQSAYSASVEAQIQVRRDAMRKHGVVRGKAYVPKEDQGG